MQEKQIWSEVSKIIKRCERRRKPSCQEAAKPAAVRHAVDGDAAPSLPGSSRQQKYDVFMQAVEDIMRRDHEVNMQITLRGDMARAFHISMAIGKYLWNKDEDSMVQQIMQIGVENVINDYNSEAVLKESRKILKPMLREIMRELEDEEIQ